ncbi:LysR family transcriptional regulator [Kiloniella sp. b19]|uniref:LysR family transcriptional regulator n=1 Tax=Kiloniella sp. GXU_MW_B19 TaxID=3141326 RepID=UPI0031DACCE9
MHLNSEELLVILALCQERTLEKAAVSLGKNSSSVFRAIKRIEEKTGQPLFSRSKKGFHPFPLASELAGKGRQISDALAEANALGAEQDSHLTGKLRVTTTDLLLEYYILPNLQAFRQKHPDLDMEFDTNNQFAKLWERDVDVAFRPSSQPPEQMIGHFLKELGYRVVCTPEYWAKAQNHSELLCNGDWLLPGGMLYQHPVRKWFSNRVQQYRTITGFDSMGLLIKAAKLGQGLAILPDLPPVLEGLTVLETETPKDKTELWCLYHPSNKQNPRIQAFTRFLKHITDN